MMDRFLFRGKDYDGNWQTGSLVRSGNNEYYIYTSINIFWAIEDIATIGQCTGLKDENGNLIFEGDIIKSVHPSPDVPKETGIVKWHNDELGWQLDTGGKYLECIGYGGNMYEIVGNIHDNPELLEVTANEN